MNSLSVEDRSALITMVSFMTGKSEDYLSNFNDEDLEDIYYRHMFNDHN